MRKEEKEKRREKIESKNTQTSNCVPSFTTYVSIVVQNVWYEHCCQHSMPFVVKQTNKQTKSSKKMDWKIQQCARSSLKVIGKTESKLAKCIEINKQKTNDRIEGTNASFIRSLEQMKTKATQKLMAKHCGKWLLLFYLDISSGFFSVYFTIIGHKAAYHVMARTKSW